MSPPSLATAGLILLSRTFLISSTIKLLSFFGFSKISEFFRRIGFLFFTKWSFISDIIEGLRLSHLAFSNFLTLMKLSETKTNSTPSNSNKFLIVCYSCLIFLFFLGGFYMKFDFIYYVLFILPVIHLFF